MRVIVRRGQVATVGRTAWADFSVPADAKMADVHFELDVQGQGCQLRTRGAAITVVNGEPAAEVWLRSGDKVTAGQTTFAVQLPVGPSSPTDQAPVAEVENGLVEPPAENGPVDKPPTAAQYCARIKLGEDAKSLLTADSAPAEFFESLVAEQLFSDALLFLACWLPKTDAVRWGCDCVAGLSDDHSKPTDVAALEAAQLWAEDSSEKNCRSAEAVANNSGFEGPASWLALAAFWSGPSLAPPDLPVVPPAEGLTAQAVAAALTMAATQGDPLGAEGRYTQFLKKGRAVAEKMMSTPGQS
jgi:hypothetical protein